MNEYLTNVGMSLNVKKSYKYKNVSQINECLTNPGMYYKCTNVLQINEYITNVGMTLNVKMSFKCMHDLQMDVCPTKA